MEQLLETTLSRSLEAAPQTRMLQVNLEETQSQILSSIEATLGQLSDEHAANDIISAAARDAAQALSEKVQESITATADGVKLLSDEHVYTQEFVERVLAEATRLGELTRLEVGINSIQETQAANTQKLDQICEALIPSTVDFAADFNAQLI